jgi:hypothetical protein
MMVTTAKKKGDSSTSLVKKNMPMYNVVNAVINPYNSNLSNIFTSNGFNATCALAANSTTNNAINA